MNIIYPFHPVEILQYIAQHLNTHDLLSCILVYKVWSNTFRPVLWDTVVASSSGPDFFTPQNQLLPRHIHHLDYRTHPSDTRIPTLGFTHLSSLKICPLSLFGEVKGLDHLWTPLTAILYTLSNGPFSTLELSHDTATADFWDAVASCEHLRTLVLKNLAISRDVGGDEMAQEGGGDELQIASATSSSSDPAEIEHDHHLQGLVPGKQIREFQCGNLPTPLDAGDLHKILSIMDALEKFCVRQLGRRHATQHELAPLSRHMETLVELDIRVCDLDQVTLVTFLGQCPRLQVYVANGIDAKVAVKSQPWVCTGRRVLRVAFRAAENSSYAEMTQIEKLQVQVFVL
ncbi:hypothetical protein BGZ82_011009 [Podila clonocystis]|nr:hypothetical protein BGZ82_011009 [Podila clonocystis]